MDTKILAFLLSFRSCSHLVLSLTISQMVLLLLLLPILPFHMVMVFNWFFGPFLVSITLFCSNIKSEDTFFSSQDSTLLESRGPKKMCSLISY